MHLTKTERKWLHEILDSLMPPGGEGGFAPSATEAGAGEVFEDMLRLLPFTTAVGMRAALYFIEILGPAFGAGRLSRFSWLGQEEREQCLAGMSKSKVFLARQMVLLMKSAACLGWAGDDRIREAIGLNLPPKFVKREEAP